MFIDPEFHYVRTSENSHSFVSFDMNAFKSMNKNNLCFQMGRDREQKKKYESEESESEDSDFSDIDYNLTHIPEHLGFINKDRLQESWNNQSGCCFITNIPLQENVSDSIYSIDVAPRRITEPVSDTNFVIVARGVKQMQESVGLTWTQFKSFLAMCANGMD